MVTKELLLEQLPQYEDRWVLINPNQKVHDIIKEVLAAHDDFAPYYDKIAVYFDGWDSLKELASNLYNFCKKNLRYNEETEDFQSTSVPQGLLYRGECDCKGYANFIGGILDGLNRLGHKIKWMYRFASYDLLDKSPHHVFIVIYDNKGNDVYYVDPTPGSQGMQPVWNVDKKIAAPATNNQIGSLHRNIAGMPPAAQSLTLGKRPYWQLMSAEGIRGKDGNHGTNPYFSGPFLALQHYKEDPFSIEGTDWNLTSDDLQNKSGIDWQPDFVKWIYETSNKFWNFYDPHGVTPGYVPNLPAAYPHLVITPDYRLTLDRDAQLDDFQNDEIQALAAWAQDLINKFDSTPYPLQVSNLKLFSQSHTGNPGNPAANLFNEHRGVPFFKQVLKKLEDFVNLVKEGVLKIVGIIPRNAFLGAVGLNIFHMADHLATSIQEGHWDHIKSLWEGIGGNADKLLNTIEHGSKQPAIEDTNAQVNETIGVVQVAAILATAAPIIAMFLKYLNKDGKLDPVIQSLQAGLQATFPDQDFSFLDGTLLSHGKPVQYVTDPTHDENSPHYNPTPNVIAWAKQNPIPVAGGAAIAVALLTKKRGQKMNLTLSLLIGGGLYFFLTQPAAGKSNSPAQLPPPTNPGLTITTMRGKLIEWVKNAGTDSPDSISYMTSIFNTAPDSEITDIYNYIFNYVLPGKPLDPNSTLGKAVNAFAVKYDIFT